MDQKPLVTNLFAEIDTSSSPSKQTFDKKDFKDLQNLIDHEKIKEQITGPKENNEETIDKFEVFPELFNFLKKFNDELEEYYKNKEEQKDTKVVMNKISTRYKYLQAELEDARNERNLDIQEIASMQFYADTSVWQSTAMRKLGQSKRNNFRILRQISVALKVIACVFLQFIAIPQVFWVENKGNECAMHGVGEVNKLTNTCFTLGLTAFLQLYVVKIIREWVDIETDRQQQPPGKLLVARMPGMFMSVWSFGWTLASSTILLAQNNEGPAGALKDALCLIFVLTAHKEIVSGRDQKIHSIILERVLNEMEKGKSISENDKKYGDAIEQTFNIKCKTQFILGLKILCYIGCFAGIIFTAICTK